MTGYILLAIVAGTLGGIHVPINGALGVRIQSTLVATFAFYGVAFLIIAFACALLAERAAFTALLTVPRWYYFAGIISVVVVGSSTFLIRRLGAVNVFVIFSLPSLRYEWCSRTSAGCSHRSTPSAG